MYQVFHVVSPEKGAMQFILRGDVKTRREATRLSQSVRNEKESGTSKKKAAIYDGDRLIQCVF